MAINPATGQPIPIIYTVPAQQAEYELQIAGGNSHAQAVASAQLLASYKNVNEEEYKAVSGDGDTDLNDSLLRYPYESLTENTDYFRIIIKRRQNGGVLEGPTAFKNTTQAKSISNKAVLSETTLAPGGMIVLPIPSNVNDSNSVSYNAGTMNNITGAALQTVPDMMGDGLRALKIKNLEEFLGKAVDASGLKTERAATLIQQQLAVNAVNIFGANVSLDQLLARKDNKIFNPNMELLFDGVKLRSFNFQFKMTPRDYDESRQTKLIIRSLKRNMAPTFIDQGNLFVKSPNVFELAYMRGSAIHPFLNKFKQCALTDMKVNYTGENVYAVYGDSTPVSMILDLSFQELVPIYQNDYANDPKGATGVGY